MKTRNAYALRDFDLERFFSRKFFRELKIISGVDVLIELQNFWNDICLIDLEARIIHHIPSMEKKILILQEALRQLDKFERRLFRHSSRLSFYQGYLSDRILNSENCSSDFLKSIREKNQRINKLDSEYSVIILQNKKLIAYLENKIFEVKEWIQFAYQDNFSRRLRVARQNKKMTQEQVADKLEISRVGYAHYELAERDPSMTMLIKLSRILDIDIKWLCGIENK